MTAIALILALCAGLLVAFAAALAAALRLRAGQDRATSALAAESAARAAAASQAALCAQARDAAEAQAARARDEAEASRRETAQLRGALDEKAARHAAALAQAQAELQAEVRARAESDSKVGGLEALLSSERAQAAEKQALLQQAEGRLTDTFHALSGKALEQSAEQLVKLAEARFNQLQEAASGDLARRQQAIDQLVGPMREQLEKVGGKLHELEAVRLRDSATLAETLRAVAETQAALKGETQRLVAALRAPQTRGRWAEVHLRRVVELAGLQEHCDFVEQATVAGEEGTLRPDLVVKLPGGSQVVIDAKAPLLAWLEANQAGGPLVLDEDQRRELYRNHARQVRAHVASLSDKAYWAQFDKAPDFVVLFLPTEAVLGAALEADPDLHEYAITRHVLLATPMTLIALLRTVAWGWRQAALADNAREISEQGRILYKRLATLAEHFGSVGKSLKRAVDSYNEAVGSLERSVLPAARRLKECKAVGVEAELPAVPVVDPAPRAIQSEELLPAQLPDSAN